MVLKWLLAGIAVIVGGFGMLQSAVFLQSYLLLVAGVALAASGMFLLVKERPAIAAA